MMLNDVDKLQDYFSVRIQGAKIFQYCTCPAGQVTYSVHLSCKPRHLSFKSVCNKEYMGVMTSSSNSSHFTRNNERTSGIFVPWHT